MFVSNLKLNAVETGYLLWSEDDQAMLTKAPVIPKGKAPSPCSAVSEKVRTRLEELDDLEEVCVFEFFNVELNFNLIPPVQFLVSILTTHFKCLPGFPERAA